MSKMYKSLDFGLSNTVTDLRAPQKDTDAVRLIDLQQVSSRDLAVPLAGGIVSGRDTQFQVIHNFNSLNVIERVFDSTNGESVNTDFMRDITDLNKVIVIFRGNSNIPDNQFVILLHKVA